MLGEGEADASAVRHIRSRWCFILLSYGWGDDSLVGIELNAASVRLFCV